MVSSVKDGLRERLKAERQQLSAAQVHEAGHKIINQCLKSVNWARVKSLHVYLPIKEQNEVDTWPLIAKVTHESSHITVAVPRLHKGKMEAVVPSAKTKMKKNRFGITEPVSGKVLPASYKFDVIIVPVLGFDKKGHRLGYGSGYYDRFLASQPKAQTIGLCYQLGFVKKELPAEKHDTKLKMVITESGRVV